MISGYDVSGKHANAVLAEYDALRSALESEDRELVQAELAVLTTFADICELSRNKPTSGESAKGRIRPQPPRALPHLPALTRLRARRFAGVVPHETRTGTSPLRRHRSGRSPGRRGSGVPTLPGSAAHGSPDPGHCSTSRRAGSSATRLPVRSAQELNEVLDRLIVATQVPLPPSSATSPATFASGSSTSRAFRKVREDVYDGVRGNLAYLEEQPERCRFRRANRQSRRHSPTPLLDLLGRKIASATAMAALCSRSSRVATTRFTRSKTSAFSSTSTAVS